MFGKAFHNYQSLYFRVTRAQNNGRSELIGELTGQPFVLLVTLAGRTFKLN